MIRKRYRASAPRRENSGGSGQTGFNMMMGAGSAQSALSRFKNPNSTNTDIKTINPFREMLDATGASDF